MKLIYVLLKSDKGYKIDIQSGHITRMKLAFFEENRKAVADFYGDLETMFVLASSKEEALRIANNQA